MVNVFSLADAGAGSLRQAIIDAVAGDTIFIQVEGTIVLTTGELVVNKALTIKSYGPSHLTISGNGASRVFNVNAPGAGSQFVISDLTIANGNAGGQGGGILLGDEQLTLERVNIRNNTATDGGGVSVTGGGTLRVLDSTINNNVTTNVGGGGIIVAGGGSSATISNTTIANNQAAQQGGGVNVQAGGVVTVNSSTIAANIAGLNAGGVSSGGTVTLNNSIIADNIGGAGAIEALSGNAGFTANYSLIESLPTLGTAINAGPGLISGVDPGLGALQNNGGPVSTKLPAQGGPAFNAGNNALAAGLPFDARGLPRISGAGIDLGAAEIQIIVAPAPPSGGDDDGGLAPRGPASDAIGANILRYLPPTLQPLPGTVTTPTGQILPNPLIQQRDTVAAMAADRTLFPTDKSILDAIVDMADATTAVAVMNYQFFTGRIPMADGIDFLVNSATNTADLNDGYYGAMSVENRFINFAINLGKLGQGAAAFNAGYGALTLDAATSKAYAEIFGVTPSAAKVAAILTPARQAYLTALGVDAIGTKAAMVGYLLAEAAKSDLGTYAVINENFLYDLADGVAAFGAPGQVYLNAGPQTVSLIGLG